MDRIKCVAVGDRGVGTTSMLRAYARDEGTASEPGKAAEEGRFTRQVAVEEGTCELTLWDTTRLEDYSQTDVFIICYDVTLASSLASVIEKWNPELVTHAPRVPLLLVGTKADLHDSGVEGMITEEAAANVANAIGAEAVVACSAEKGDGLNDVFELVVKTARDAKKDPAARTKQREAQRELVEVTPVRDDVEGEALSFNGKKRRASRSCALL